MRAGRLTLLQQICQFQGKGSQINKIFGGPELHQEVFIVKSSSKLGI